MFVTWKLKGFVYIVVNDLVVDHTDADTAFAFEEAIDGMGAHPRGEDAVEGARRTTALDAAEDLGFRLEPGFFGDALSKGMDIWINLLADDDDGTFLLRFIQIAKACHNLFLRDWVVGGDDHLGAFG